MKRYRVYIAVVAAAASVGAVTLAQEKPIHSAAEPSYIYVNVRADKTRYKWGNAEVALLSGHVKITQGDTVLTADEIEYNENEDIQTAVATGNVKIVDPDTEITGEKATAYFNEKRAVIDGKVRILVKPKSKKPEEKDKESVRSELKDKAVITCDSIEYFYKNKEANASGNLQVVQKDRTITAGKAFYQVKQEILTLSGGVKGRDSKNQTFSAPGSVTASIKEGDEWLEMENATGTFRVKDEEEEEEQAPAIASPAAEAESEQQ